MNEEELFSLTAGYLSLMISLLQAQFVPDPNITYKMGNFSQLWHVD
jgi:hypothetical protein